MKNCDNCKIIINDGKERILRSKVLCEDCYINTFFDKARKTYYLECDHSFMLRLKPGFDNRRLIK